MSGAEEQIAELRKQADALSDGPAKVALLQQAVELADVINSVTLGYDLRRSLVSAASFAGRPDVMLVAFSWNLSQFDRDPAAFDRHKLLWQYKWVQGDAQSFPEIPRVRLEALLDDLERRYREHGSTLQVVAKLRRRYQMHLGDFEAAQAAHRLYRKRKRDRLSDCAACEADADVSYMTWRRQWTRAAKLGQQALDAGLKCRSQPRGLLEEMLMPLFRLGRIDEAREVQRRGYRLVEALEHSYGIPTDHLEFLTLVGDFSQARRLVERHAPAAVVAVSPSSRYYSFEAMLFWTERLLALGTTRIKLRLPDEMPGAGADGTTDLVALRNWLLERVLDIGARFDARNGTDGFHRRRERQRELLELARAPSGKNCEVDG